MTVGKRLRPRAAQDVGERLKLRWQVVRADGREFTVLTLRPGMDVRFSTNRHHETWHLLSDLRGARLGERLLWGLPYQRRPGTVIVPDRPQPVPVALVPAHLTTMTVQAARDLRWALGAAPSQGPIIFRAGPEKLRRWARAVHPLGERMYHGSEQVFLDPHRREVPACRDVSSMGPDELWSLIWGRADMALARAARSG
ncbi:hypothetical protein [Spongiactinospora sp. 9N601]|uniref:hypothetical protein n=1 Tax=Spongiactinospora sp. 9N601 TaxID=3375149 RepID=UPI0037A612C3